MCGYFYFIPFAGLHMSAIRFKSIQFLTFARSMQLSESNFGLKNNAHSNEEKNYGLAVMGECRWSRWLVGSSSVGPDWAILQVFGNKLSHKCSQNILLTYWAISNNETIMLKVCSYFLDNFWGKLVNFLIHHLVTLFVIHIYLL